MRPEYLFELDDLELFFAKNNYDISRATITRYGQNGLMLAPRRKNRVGSLSGSRIYYHPLAAIEILTANLLLSGNYLNEALDCKICRFTIDDIFFARLNYYRNHKNPSIVYDYDSIIRIQDGKKYKSYKLSMNYANLVAVWDSICEDPSTGNVIDTDDFNFLKNRYKKYKKRFLTSELELNTEKYGTNHIFAEELHKNYSELVLSLYRRTMDLLSCKHQEELSHYNY